MPASVTAPPPRPRSVLRGCLLAGGGAALVLVACLTVVGQLGSAELRDQIEQAPNPFGVEVDPDHVLRTMRWMLTGVAVLSVSAVVFAAYAFRGHRASRLGLTVLVPVMLLPSAVSGWAGLVPALLAVGGVVLLWSSPSRAWFAAVGGGAAPARAVSTQRGDAMSTPTPPPGQEPHDHSGPPPPPQYGAGYGQQQGYDPQYGQQPYGAEHRHGQPSPYPTKRPGVVTAAAVIAMVMSVLTAAGWLVFGALALAASSAEIDDLYNSNEFQRGMGDANISLEDFENGVTGFGIAFLVLGVVILLAVLPAIGVLRGSGVSRVVLTILSVITVLVGLFFTVAGTGTGIPWVLAGVLVLVFLFVGAASAWFAGKKAGAV